MRNVVDAPDKPCRKLLLVSYWYPPAVGAAAERIHAFARYLPDHGWRTHVLTAERAGLGGESADVSVHGVVDRFAREGPAFPDFDPAGKTRSALRSFAREWFFPDRFRAWQRAASQVGADLARKEAFDLILVSFPPASAVMLALHLHRESGTPLVLDYRDRWFGPGGYEPKRRRARRAHERLERQAVAAASAVVTVSEAMAEAVAAEQDYPRDRVFVISNGYEPADIAGRADDGPAPSRSPKVGPSSVIGQPSSSTQADRVTIAHVGTVIPRNRPDLFFESVKTMTGDACLRGVSFKFVGNLSQAYLDANALSSIITTTGLVPRAQAHREMQTADVLLLLTGSYVGKWGCNAKVFEYVQAGRPVLCLEESPGSNDRRLLERFAPDRAFFAPVDQPDAVADQLDRLRRYLREHPGRSIELDDAFRAYSRPALAAQLAEHLDDVAARR